MGLLFSIGPYVKSARGKALDHVSAVESWGLSLHQTYRQKVLD